jgi:hypothetical protein
MNRTPAPRPTQTGLRRLARFAVITACVFIGAMWVYAFLFASRESINKINDAQWAQRSQVRCQQAATERTALTDFTRIDEKDASTLLQRAIIVDKATDTLEAMVSDIAKDTPSDAKGQALVPMWIADYRTYIEDRRDYTEDLRAGRLPTFAETKVDGVPISERIGKFARENKMRACQPPFDLVV